jgi:hypothetical protein
MKVAVCYVYPLINVRLFYQPAKRFADTYRYSSQLIPRDLHIMVNGGKPMAGEMAVFNGLNYQKHEYNNLGWDIGAFQWAAENIACDLMVFCGTHVHFHKPMWLERMVEAYIQNGPALYGCWAYLTPNWHVRTTCFWCPPQLINAYPNQVGSARASRYVFDLGGNSITRFALSAGMDCFMVTWEGVFPFSQWQEHAPGPEQSLVLDQHVHR